MQFGLILCEFKVIDPLEFTEISNINSIIDVSALSSFDSFKPYINIIFVVLHCRYQKILLILIRPNNIHIL